MRLCHHLLLPVLLFALACGRTLPAQTAVPPAERSVFDLVNEARATHHLPALLWDPALARAAQLHALRIVHEPLSLEHQYRGEPDLVTRAAAGAHFSVISENLARGNRSVADLVALWMTTPIHRANILNPQLDRTGIGVVAWNGLLYAVQDFSHAAPVLSRDAAELQIAGQLHQAGIPSAASSSAAREVCESRGTASPGARLVVGWDGDVTALPALLLQHLQQASFTRAAVGVCSSDRPADGFPNAHAAVLLF